ncbi:energy transducer TonB [Leptolyngbya sp. 7M]|uniref:energy transducer TonB n=1 Tax=Leptolyngbya sp. 7M TaxID=2812896 RepID=UPI001B8D5E39|nr:energy transducer TonB [Leptolyngbya sp. 7M]QYO66866.1 energy transducer TonB [Leptolyngbya sp. 7M]
MQRVAPVFALLTILSLATLLSSAQGISEVSGGILNGKAVKMPKPQYPDELRVSGIRGTVKIAVLINEEGNVVSAEPVYNEDVMFRSDGRTVEKQPSEQPHPLLVDEAKKAALEAKFAPTILSGHPVKVKGVLVYNFGGETGETAAAQSLPDVEPVATRGNMPMPISGGVLNGKALSLPQPVYPPAARALKADGAVIVQVVVDENGEIISASAVSGHPLLRISSEKAARLARFSPTTLNGQPVKVSGVITYNYVLTLGEDEVQALWGFGFIFKFIASADQELLGYFGTEAFNDIVKEMSEDIPEGLEFLRPMLAKIPGSDEPVRRRLAEDMLKEFGKRVKNSELPYFNTGILTGELAANIFSMKMERGLGKVPDDTKAKALIRELGRSLEEVPFDPSGTTGSSLRRLASMAGANDLTGDSAIEAMIEALDSIFKSHGDCDDC